MCKSKQHVHDQRQITECFLLALFIQFCKIPEYLKECFNSSAYQIINHLLGIQKALADATLKQ